MVGWVRAGGVWWLAQAGGAGRIGSRGCSEAEKSRWPTSAGERSRRDVPTPEAGIMLTPTLWHFEPFFLACWLMAQMGS